MTKFDGSMINFEEMVTLSVRVMFAVFNFAAKPSRVVHDDDMK